LRGTNRGASAEPGEPEHGGFAGGHSIWWTWTAPSTGGAEIISQGALFFFTPVLAVYTGASLDRRHRVIVADGRLTRDRAATLLAV